MLSSSITLRLESLWHVLTDEWKEVLAQNLELEGCFEKNDIDYILTLKALDCSDSKITDLTPLRYFTHLESLDISHIYIPDFSPLLALPNLKEFHAVYSNFSNTRLLTHMKHLEVLDLSYTKAEHVDLAGLSQLFHLKELYCNGCYITSLKDIYPLAGLDVLSIFFNKIDAEEVRIFQKIYPDCRVLK